MNYFAIPYVCLPIETTSALAPWVDPRQVEAWLSNQSVLRVARAQAAQMLKKARHTRNQLWERFQKSQKQAELQAQAVQNAQLEQAKSQAVQEAVQWVGQSQVLSETLYHAMLKKAKVTLFESLERLLPKIEWNALLQQEIEHYLSNQPPQLFGTLKVPINAALDSLPSLKACPNLRVLEDPDLDPGQARLETEFFTAHLDLPKILKTIHREWKVDRPEASKEESNSSEQAQEPTEPPTQAPSTWNTEESACTPSDTQPNAVPPGDPAHEPSPVDPAKEPESKGEKIPEADPESTALSDAEDLTSLDSEAALREVAPTSHGPQKQEDSSEEEPRDPWDQRPPARAEHAAPDQPDTDPLLAAPDPSPQKNAEGRGFPNGPDPDFGLGGGDNGPDGPINPVIPPLDDLIPASPRARVAPKAELSQAARQPSQSLGPIGPIPWLEPGVPPAWPLLSGDESLSPLDLRGWRFGNHRPISETHAPFPKSYGSSPPASPAQTGTSWTIPVAQGGLDGRQGRGVPPSDSEGSTP